MWSRSDPKVQAIRCVNLDNTKVAAEARLGQLRSFFRLVLGFEAAHRDKEPCFGRISSNRTEGKERQAKNSDAHHCGV